MAGATQVRLETRQAGRRPDRVHLERRRPFRICSTSAIETPRESSSTAR
jgi:hypothetical protein